MEEITKLESWAGEHELLLLIAAGALIVLAWLVIGCLMLGALRRLNHRVDTINAKINSLILPNEYIVAANQSLNGLRDDFREAFFKKTMCDQCDSEFEYPSRSSGIEATCPKCDAPMRLP